MLYYDRINVSEGIDVDIDVDIDVESKQCDICRYWHFIKKEFKSQPNVCNRCHDLLMMSIDLSDIAILNIKDADYRYIISGISKSEAINFMENIDLTEKSGTL